jgi:Lon protease-like protein
VTDRLPMFPLNAVLFPGVTVPLKVFEDRYRAMVHHLLRVPDPTLRQFGSVGIREGYEVGDHGAQSLYRVGCRVKLSEVESHPDGTFDVLAVGLDRIELERLDTTGAFPVGHVVPRPEPASEVPHEVLPTTCLATRSCSRGRSRPSRRYRCTSGRPCWRRRTPPSGCAWSPTCSRSSCGR